MNLQPSSTHRHSAPTAVPGTSSVAPPGIANGLDMEDEWELSDILSVATAHTQTRILGIATANLPILPCVSPTPRLGARHRHRAAHDMPEHLPPMANNHLRWLSGRNVPPTAPPAVLVDQ